MLNFTVTMSPWLSLSRIILGLWLVFTNQQDVGAEGISLISPKPGEAVQGVVSILGTTQVTGFSSAQLSFTYSTSSIRSWFLIGESQKPVTNETIVTWDTTSITDGNYDLQLVVTLNDGSQLNTLVTGIRVRNYTPINGNSPLPTLSENILEPTLSTPTLVGELIASSTTQFLTKTALPPNPAGLNKIDLLGGMLKGGLAVLGLFIVIWIYFHIRSSFRH